MRCERGHKHVWRQIAPLLPAAPVARRPAAQRAVGASLRCWTEFLEHRDLLDGRKPTEVDRLLLQTGFSAGNQRSQIRKRRSLW